MAETEWSTIEPGSPPEQEKVEFEIEGQEAAEVEPPEAEVETKAEEPAAKVAAEAKLAALGLTANDLRALGL